MHLWCPLLTIHFFTGKAHRSATFIVIVDRRRWCFWCAAAIANGRAQVYYQGWHRAQWCVTRLSSPRPTKLTDCWGCVQPSSRTALLASLSVSLRITVAGSNTRQDASSAEMTMIHQISSSVTYVARRQQLIVASGATVTLAHQRAEILHYICIHKCLTLGGSTRD
jgi:hypothetical protein